MSAKLRLNSWVLPGAVVLLLVLQIIDPSRTWNTLLVMLGGALLIGYLWARGLAKNLRLMREIRYGWAQVGDELEERFTIVNDSLFPATWVEIEDFSTLPDYHTSLATAVSNGSANEFISQGHCSRRGLYTLGGTRLKTSDPLGIYTVSIDDPSSQMLLVLPPVVPLPSIDVTPGGFMGGGRPRSTSTEKTIDAAGVREYQPGDPMRMIHWPTTAKHNKPFIRLPDDTPAADWWILLDLDGKAQVGTGSDSTEEHAIILAASLADLGLRNRKAVGLAINGQDVCWKPPAYNQSQRHEILRALALARSGELDLKNYLERNGKSFGKRSSLVVITANVSGSWAEALAPLRWRGVAPTVLLIDPVTFGGTGNAGVLSSQLSHLSISCHIISRDLLDRPEAHPGQSGQWQWRTSTTGKVTPLHKPVDSEWRRLS